MIPIVFHNRRFVAAAVVVLLTYLLTLAIAPKRVFWTPDEGAKWFEMHSVEVRGDLRYVVNFPAQRVDKEFRYLPHYGLFPKPQIAKDGNLYLAFETPVIFPLLSSVSVGLFGVVGIYVLPLLSGWLVAVAAGALAAAICPAAAPGVVLLVGLATPVWFYSVLFWEHTLATLLGFLAVALVAVSPPWSIAALIAALATFFAIASLRMELLALGGAVAIAWAMSGRAVRGGRGAALVKGSSMSSPWLRAATYLGLLIASAGVVVFLRAAVTLRHYKLLSELPERLQLGIGKLTTAPWNFLDVLIHASINEAPPASDAWVAAAAIGVALCLIAAFVRRPRLEALLFFPGALLLLAFSVWLLTIPEVYRALHGFIPIAPFVVVAPYAWTQTDPRDRGYVLVFLSVLAAVYPLTAILGISAIYIENGRLDVGIEWGQRYLLTLYVIAAVLAVIAVQSYWRSSRPLWLRRAFVAVFALMVATAFAFQVRGIEMLHSTRVRLTVWEDAMRREGPLVTDVWWLPAAFAVLYTEHEMYYVVRRENVADWVAEAIPHGLRGFTFVTFEPVKVEQFRSDRVHAALSPPRRADGLYLARFVLRPSEHPSQPQK